MLQRFKISRSNVMLLLLLLAFPTYSNANKETISLDRDLINNLKKNNFKAAENLLKRGANPEANFGKYVDDSALCTAVDNRSSELIELLVKYGASTNAYSKLASSRYKTPLACSVFLVNFEAFEYLLENGADPSLDLYDRTNENRKFASTALTLALGTKTYPMALKLVKLYPLHPAELKRLAFDLENSPYTEDHPWNSARSELIAWTKERVPTLNPRPASPSDGRPRKCLFHFRDIEEGLKKGTVCWDTDEN